MKAIHFTGLGIAGMADLNEPELAPGHALVRVMASGLCHTDIDVLYGRYGNGAFPLVPGHEYAGVIEAVARDVTGFRAGDRVAIDPNIPCGTCRSCGKGLTNLCESLEAYGVTRNGGFAEYSMVNSNHLHPIGDLPFHIAALAEPLACVQNGLGNAHAVKAENALVFGAGPIGLLMALSLKAQGVDDVSVADINESRLAFAQSLGLKPVVSGSSGLEVTRKAFDFVADATGIAHVVQDMIAYTADGGTALIFGVSVPDARIEIAPFEIFRRQISLVGSHSLNRNIPEALAILQRDDGMMAKLVSHRLPLADVLPFLAKGTATPQTMKVQFSAG
ncbi:zinc-dependent alcohol dehydrogenase family protein [Phyllobacterium sp. 628]|uniref:zinc-dependent alcohol dehydrogenase family protein n=1 Tax=Phyllobacterium sp. 628 TaxID=2718938 RepID=UPI0016623AEA|nr:zinc-dependent alcohol dehydrogenase family protein [Phyllobacterium sp. 628]QND51301.1 zinc-dependent alcohol dehydrogenase family protein [Phyllobacterium sp. 628]